jgi:flagellar basal-body rod protein FlgB
MLVSNFSTAVILKALDCLSARALITAENIANGGTIGYRPRRLSFEKALQSAAAQGESDIKAVQPSIRRDGRAGSASLRLDLELATASSTALRYAALIDVLNRQMQIEALAIQGGN